MSTSRKFHRTIVVIDILSEEPYPLDGEDAKDVLAQIGYDITEGHCSGDIYVTEAREVDGPTMAKLLAAQHSDPEFFNLTPTGEDLPECGCAACSDHHDPECDCECHCRAHEDEELREGDPCPKCGATLLYETDYSTGLACLSCGSFWDAHTVDSTGEPEHAGMSNTEET